MAERPLETTEDGFLVLDRTSTPLPLAQETTSEKKQSQSNPSINTNTNTQDLSPGFAQPLSSSGASRCLGIGLILLIAIFVLMPVLLFIKEMEPNFLSVWPINAAPEVAFATIFSYFSAATVIAIWNFIFNMGSRKLVSPTGHHKHGSTVALTTALIASILSKNALEYSTELFETDRHGAVSLASTAAYISFNEAMLRIAAYREILAEEYQASPELDPECPTGDCKWEPFTSLGVCVSLSDVTSQLNISHTERTGAHGGIEQGIKASLLNDTAYLEDWDSIYSSGWADEFQNITSMPLARTQGTSHTRETAAAWNSPDIPRAALSQLFIIYRWEEPDREPETVYHAIELILHLCVKTYDVSVVSGVPHTSIVDEYVNVTDLGPGRDRFNMTDRHGNKFEVKADSAFHPNSEPPERLLGDLSTPYHDACIFGCRGQSAEAALFLHQMWNIHYGLSDYSLEKSFKTPKDEQIMINLRYLTGNIAHAWTTYMRRGDHGHSFRNKEIRGKVFAEKSIVRVKPSWLWLLSSEMGIYVIYLMLKAVRWRHSE